MAETWSTGVNPAVLIRQACLDDLEALSTLLGQLFSIEADFTVDGARQRRGLELILEGAGENHSLQVAEIKGQVVGMCSVQVLISTAEGGTVGLLEDLVVEAAFRGRGIGRRLLTSIEAWARERGLTRLQLLADRTNFRALDFYDRMSWLPTNLICLRRTWS